MLPLSGFAVGGSGAVAVVILLRQFVPLDRQLTAGAPVLLVPVGQEIKTGVIDIVEALNVDMNVGTRLQRFELGCKLWQLDQSRRAVEVNIDAV